MKSVKVTLRERSTGRLQTVKGLLVEDKVNNESCFVTREKNSLPNKPPIKIDVDKFIRFPFCYMVSARETNWGEVEVVEIMSTRLATGEREILEEEADRYTKLKQVWYTYHKEVKKRELELQNFRERELAAISKFASNLDAQRICKAQEGKTGVAKIENMCVILQQQITDSIVNRTYRNRKTDDIVDWMQVNEVKGVKGIKEGKVATKYQVVLLLETGKEVRLLSKELEDRVRKNDTVTEKHVREHTPSGAVMYKWLNDIHKYNEKVKVAQVKEGTKVGVCEQEKGYVDFYKKVEVVLTFSATDILDTVTKVLEELKKYKEE